MATITWPATMRIRKQDELEDKLILVYSCAASIVEQFHHVAVKHLNHITVRCFSRHSVEVTFIAPNNEDELVNMCKATFDYCTESHHWTFGTGNELYKMYAQITDNLVDDPKEEDAFFDLIFRALTSFEIKTSVEIESKYVGVK